MEQAFESFIYLLEIILAGKEPKSRTLQRIKERQNVWEDLYDSLVTTENYQSAVDIVVYIFGKETYSKKIGLKILQKLRYFICRSENSVTCARRNRNFSRPTVCVLGLAKTLSNKEDLKLEVEILRSVFMNKGAKLELLMKKWVNNDTECDLVITRCKGMNLVHFAVIWSNNDSLQVLLKFMGKKAIDERDVYGFAPLHYAVEFGNVTSAHLLLDNGANVNSKLQNDVSPLHLAAFHIFPDLILLLCEHGAHVNYVDSNLETPLLAATRSRKSSREIRERLGLHSTAISLLLRYGSSPNARNLHRETPLQNVLLHCTDLNCAHLLMSAGAEVFNAEENRSEKCNYFWKNSRSQKMRTFLEMTRKSLPHRLEVLCLIAIRKALGTQFSKRVKSLQLHRDLEKMLLFQKLPKLF